MTPPPYRLGLPMWGNKDWVGTLYAPRTRAADFLEQYASVFSSVEGNTTFYSLPSVETVERWREQTPEHFRFCFKLPKTITHDRRLRDAGRETAEFFGRMEPLGERLGPFMIQLPASFGPDNLRVLAKYIETLPSQFRFGVELRHPTFYHDDEAFRAANGLLGVCGCERVMMDTSGMRAGDRRHPDVLAAEHKKPDLPIVPVVTARDPMLRFVGHPEDAVNTPFFESWAAQLAAWIRERRSPYVFMHCPNNAFAPAMAQRLHELLREKSSLVGELPEWPGVRHRDPRQLDLL
jgi:uncharacterized protein YecE (DUF72 family)